MKTTATDTDVLGCIAAVWRKVGKGRITYVGGVLDAKLMTAATEWMAKTSQVSATFGKVPDGIEVSRRVGKDSSVFVLIRRRSLPMWFCRSTEWHSGGPGEGARGLAAQRRGAGVWAVARLRSLLDAKNASLRMTAPY
jgi:beta-galactosidase